MGLECYIKSELLVLIPVLYLFGVGLKKGKVKDSYIPLILGAVSVLLCGIWVFATTPVKSAGEALLAIFTAVTQGILLAGASVYADQLSKQSKNEKKKNKNKKD